MSHVSSISILLSLKDPFTELSSHRGADPFNLERSALTYLAIFSESKDGKKYGQSTIILFSSSIIKWRSFLLKSAISLCRLSETILAQEFGP